MIEQPKPNSNGVSDRRGISPRRANDITASDVAVVTKSVYQNIMRRAPEDMSLKVRNLCLMKQKLGQCLLHHDACIKHVAKEMGTPTYAALKRMRARLEKLYNEVPLEIV